MNSPTHLTRLIAALTILLALLSVVMVFSSSAFQTKRPAQLESLTPGLPSADESAVPGLPLWPRSSWSAYSTLWFFVRQLAWTALGLMALVVASQTDYPRWRTWVWPLFLGAIGALLLVWSPLGSTRNGASSWIKLYHFTLQPAEFAKIALVIFLADLFARKQDILRSSLLRTLPLFLPPLGIVALVFLQPDLGMATLMVLLIAAIWFLAGARLWHLLVIAAVGSMLLSAALYQNPNARRRIETFLHPDQASPASRYQVDQAKIAFAKGGIWGVGLGEGQQKMHFLPAPHTDCIFAVLAEELGFIASLAFLLAYGVLLWAGFHVALKAPDLFGTLLAGGLTIMLALGALINIAVVTGSIPTTGLPLPLLSYGGSSLVSSMLALGMIMNVSKNLGGARSS